MSDVLYSMQPVAGSVSNITNPAGCAAIYCVEFPGVGSVEFVVQPGASFALTTISGDVNVKIKSTVSVGIAGDVNTRNV